eukprot:886264-Rhodomonas_salina.1
MQSGVCICRTEQVCPVSCTNDWTLLEKSGDLHHQASPRLAEMMASTHNNKAGGYRQQTSCPSGLGRRKEATSGMLEWGPTVERR